MHVVSCHMVRQLDLRVEIAGCSLVRMVLEVLKTSKNELLLMQTSF